MSRSGAAGASGIRNDLSDKETLKDLQKRG
jgi:hypothetical protein